MKYKSIIACGLCCFFIMNAHAQLSNSQWKGTINIPEAHAIFWKFDKDTVKVFFPDKSEETEVMTYTEDAAAKKVSFIKISGTSPCASGYTGVYTYSDANNKLSLTPIQDTCTGRTSAVHGVFFTRVK